MISCQDIKLHLEFTLHIHVIHRGSGGILPQALYQWHSQDIEVAWAQGFDAAEGSTWSCAAWRKNFHHHFSVTRMGSRRTFVLRTASNPCLVRFTDLCGLVHSQELC